MLILWHISCYHAIQTQNYVAECGILKSYSKILAYSMHYYLESTFHGFLFFCDFKYFHELQSLTFGI